MNNGERYEKITIYTNFVDKNADYAIIDYTNGNQTLQKKIPSWEITDALSEFEFQMKRRIVYGKDVEVKNVVDYLNKGKTK